MRQIFKDYSYIYVPLILDVELFAYIPQTFVGSNLYGKLHKKFRNISIESIANIHLFYRTKKYLVRSKTLI